MKPLSSAVQIPWYQSDWHFSCQCLNRLHNCAEYQSDKPMLPFLFVSEMTYIVSSGTLNSTIPYHTFLCGDLFKVVNVYCLWVGS